EVNDAVETGFEQLEEAFAGNAALALGGREDATELALEQTVDEAELLLLGETESVFRHFAARLRAVLARREVAAFENLGGTENVGAEATADAGGGSGITGHGEFLF